MPTVAMVETFKMALHDLAHADKSTTVKGFQPKLDNVLLMNEPTINPVYDELIRILDKHSIEGQIHRSWFVSYDEGGYQNPHHHYDGEESVSGIICLLSGKGGLTIFDEKIFRLEQGDVLLFDSKLTHWSTPAETPRIVLSFDLRPNSSVGRATD